MLKPPRSTCTLDACECVEWNGFGLRMRSDCDVPFPYLSLALWGLHANKEVDQFSWPDFFDLWRLPETSQPPCIMMPNLGGELLPIARAPYSDLPEDGPRFSEFPKLEKPAVLFVFRTQSIGGDHRYHVGLMEYLREQGYFVVAVALRDGSLEFEQDIQQAADVVYVPARTIPLDWYPAFLSWLISYYGIRTAISTNSPLYLRFLAYLRARHPGVLFADIAHLVMPTVSSGGHARWTLMFESQLDLIFTESEAVRTWLMEHGLDKSKVHRLGPMLDVEWWSKTAADAQRMRRALELIPENLHLVFHGRLEQVKRPRLLLEVFAQLIKQFPFLRLTFAGSGSEEATLRKQVESCKLADSVRILGPLNAEGVRELLAAADIAVLPSQNEGLSLAMVEAMAMECVVVTADVGGHSELITPDCGVLIAPSALDEKDYFDVLANLIADPTSRRSYSHQARRVVVEQCDTQKIAHDFLGLLEVAARAGQRNHPVPISLGKTLALDGIEKFRTTQGRLKLTGTQKTLHTMLQRRVQQSRVRQNP